jgi:hypothetical protein
MFGGCGCSSSRAPLGHLWWLITLPAFVVRRRCDQTS